MFVVCQQDTSKSPSALSEGPSFPSRPLPGPQLGLGMEIPLFPHLMGSGEIPLPLSFLQLEIKEVRKLRNSCLAY
jgi:hypothetical protein